MRGGLIQGLAALVARRLCIVDGTRTRRLSGTMSPIK
jgi:hypothetical protein